MDHPLVPPETIEKHESLMGNLRGLGSLMVAYSGGVDSTFLAVAAHEALGDKALAVTASSPSMAPSELRDAVDLAQTLGLNHRVIETDEVQRADYQANDPNRCFFCKDELYTHLTRLASDEGYASVANGANVDDLGDFRPGLKAARQYAVLSPLVDAALTKDEIRALSRERGLATWDKPAQACLSSRIPYGTPVTIESLSRIGQAEEFLREQGIRQVRVRHHDNIARIELEPADFAAVAEDNTRRAIVQRFRELAYAYVTLDLEGFRSGSLNEVLAGVRKRKLGTNGTFESNSEPLQRG